MHSDRNIISKPMIAAIIKIKDLKLTVVYEDIAIMNIVVGQTV